MKTISLVHYRKKQRTGFYIAAVFLGILIGSAFASFFSVTDTEWIYQYFRICSAETIKEYLIESICFSVLYIVTVFVIGLSVFGQAADFLLLLYRGAGVGASAAYMYLSTGRNAALPLLVYVFPKAIIILCISFIAIRESVYASRYIADLCIGKSMITDDGFSLRLYCLRLLVIVILLFIISAIDGGVLLLFSFIKQ